MGQEFGLKEQLGVDNAFVFGVGLRCASFSNVVERIFLTVDHFGEFQTGPKSFLHLRVVGAVKADSTQNVLVREAVESSEEDH